MNFNETAAFSKDIKHISRKYRSLTEDLLEFKKVVTIVPYGNSKHFIALHRKDNLSLIKARLFCKYLKRNSLRIVYAYDEQLKQIDFIELYFKGDQERENHERISEYLEEKTTLL